MNPNNLRIIKTARTKEAINEAAEQGYWPLVKPVTPSPEIKSKYAIYQDKETGQIQVVHDYRAMRFNDEIEKVIGYTFYYPHHFPSPFAAYLIPKDLKPNEHVWLEDLIEDIVKATWNQGDAYRLESAEAIWDGTEFIIQFRPSNRLEYIG